MNTVLAATTSFRIVVNQSLVGIGTITDGVFSYTNSKFNEIFGYNDDEILRRSPLDNFIECNRSLFTQNMLKGLNGELGKIEYVFHGLRKDGAVIDVELHGSAATFGKIGVRRTGPEAGSETSEPGVHPLEHTHAARFPPPHPRSLQRSILTKVSTGATRHRVALDASQISRLM